MRELRDVSKRLNETVAELKRDKDIGGAVKKLQQIKSKLNKIIKQST